MFILNRIVLHNSYLHLHLKTKSSKICVIYGPTVANRVNDVIVLRLLSLINAFIYIHIPTSRQLHTQIALTRADRDGDHRNATRFCYIYTFKYTHLYVYICDMFRDNASQCYVC